MKRRYYIEDYGIVFAESRQEAGNIAERKVGYRNYWNIREIETDLYKPGWHYSSKQGLWYGSLDQPARS